MLSWGMPFGWILFLLVSFWPWEKDAGEVKKTSLSIPALSSGLTTLRVALFYEKPEVEVVVRGPYTLAGIPRREVLAEGPDLPMTPIQWTASGIRVGATLYPVTGIRITSASKEVEVGKRKYHNAIQVLKNPAGSLTVVNEIEVEDYLKGVLPWESNPDWPLEALKAQAVVSRTYALFENIENRDFPFSLGSDVGSQVYGGKSIEKSMTSRAVEKTTGEILTYQGKIFPAFFHSTCGGRTSRADYEWKVVPHPCLMGVECSFCTASKHYAWREEFLRDELQRLLAKRGHSVEGIKEIRPEKLDPSGRARFFVIEHAKGSLKLTANEFRLALGADRMRSTRVRIQRLGDNFLMEGRGWGHGVGMCQFGAKRLAELGYPYRDILRYYYPASEIRNLSDVAHFSAEAPSEAEEGNIFERMFGEIKSLVEDL